MLYICIYKHNCHLANKNPSWCEWVGRSKETNEWIMKTQTSHQKTCLASAQLPKKKTQFSTPQLQEKTVSSWFFLVTLLVGRTPTHVVPNRPRILDTLHTWKDLLGAHPKGAKRYHGHNGLRRQQQIASYHHSSTILQGGNVLLFYIIWIKQFMETGNLSTTKNLPTLPTTRFTAITRILWYYII